MSDILQALSACTARLVEIASSVDDAEINAPAYPVEWSIAHVFSHLGSGAVIMQRRMDAATGGEPFSDEFQTAVWDEWDAKSPSSQVADSSVANEQFRTAIESVDGRSRERFEFVLGPIKTDFAGFAELRLNELAVHLWDIEVALDTKATLHPEAVRHVVDNLALIGSYTAKPTGVSKVIAIRTTDPSRGFRVELQPDKALFAATDIPSVADLQMPAEAFIRLVYGRLDPTHTPPFEGDPDALSLLRDVYPGP